MLEEVDLLLPTMRRVTREVLAGSVTMGFGVARFDTTGRVIGLPLRMVFQGLGLESRCSWVLDEFLTCRLRISLKASDNDGKLEICDVIGRSEMWGACKEEVEGREG